jgi:hypothetical protein
MNSRVITTSDPMLSALTNLRQRGRLRPWPGISTAPGTVAPAGGFAAGGPRTAATLRPQRAASMARRLPLADLFDELDRKGSGRSAPCAGAGHAHLSSRRAQLQQPIARQFGVDWRPASPADRAVLDRPGQMLARAPLVEAVARSAARARRR